MSTVLSLGLFKVPIAQIMTHKPLLGAGNFKNKKDKQ